MDINIKVAQLLVADFVTYILSKEFSYNAMFGIPQNIWDAFVNDSKEYLQKHPGKQFMCVRKYIFARIPIKCQEELYKNLENIYGESFLMDYIINEKKIFESPLYLDRDGFIHQFSSDGEMKFIKSEIDPSKRESFLWSPVMEHQDGCYYYQTPMKGWEFFINKLSPGDSFYEEFPKFLAMDYNGKFTSDEYEFFINPPETMSACGNIFKEYLSHVDEYHKISKTKIDRGYDIDIPRKRTDQNFDWLTITLWMNGVYSTTNLKKWFEENRNIVHNVVRKRLRSIGNLYHFLKLDSITILAQGGIEYKFSYKEV